MLVTQMLSQLGNAKANPLNQEEIDHFCQFGLTELNQLAVYRHSNQRTILHRLIITTPPENQMVTFFWQVDSLMLLMKPSITSENVDYTFKLSFYWTRLLGQDAKIANSFWDIATRLELQGLFSNSQGICEFLNQETDEKKKRLIKARLKFLNINFSEHSQAASTSTISAEKSTSTTTSAASSAQSSLASNETFENKVAQMAQDELKQVKKKHLAEKAVFQKRLAEAEKVRDEAVRAEQKARQQLVELEQQHQTDLQAKADMYSRSQNELQVTRERVWRAEEETLQLKRSLSQLGKEKVQEGARLRAEIVSLKSQYQDSVSLRSLQDRLAKTEAALMHGNKKMEEMMVTFVELNKEIKALREKVAQQEYELLNKNADYQALLAKNTDLNSQLMQLADQLQVTTAREQQRVDELTVHQEGIDQLCVEIVGLEKQLKQHKKIQAQLSANLEQAQQEKTALESTLREIEVLDQQLTKVLQRRYAPLPPPPSSVSVIAPSTAGEMNPAGSLNNASSVSVTTSQPTMAQLITQNGLLASANSAAASGNNSKNSSTPGDSTRETRKRKRVGPDRGEKVPRKGITHLTATENRIEEDSIDVGDSDQSSISSFSACSPDSCN